MRHRYEQFLQWLRLYGYQAQAYSMQLTNMCPSLNCQCELYCKHSEIFKMNTWHWMLHQSRSHTKSIFNIYAWSKTANNTTKPHYYCTAALIGSLWPNLCFFIWITAHPESLSNSLGCCPWIKTTCFENQSIWIRTFMVVPDMIASNSMKDTQRFVGFPSSLPLLPSAFFFSGNPARVAQIFLWLIRRNQLTAICFNRNNR